MSYRDAVLADNPSAYWRFEEASGDVVSDEVGSLHGTVVGAVLDTPGRVGSGIYFDGVDDHVLIPSSTMGVTGAAPHTLSLWVKPEALGGTQVVFWRGNSSSTVGRTLRIELVGSSIGIRRWGGSNDNTYSAGGLLAAGQWNHITVAYDGTHEHVYLNGSHVGSNEVLAALQSDSVQLGRRPNGQWPLRGEVDEVSFFPHLLTQARIAAHYEAADEGPGDPDPINTTLPRASISARADALTLSAGPVSISAPRASISARTSAPEAIAGAVASVMPRASLTARTSAPGVSAGPASTTLPRAGLSARTSAPSLSIDAVAAVLPRVSVTARTEAPTLSGGPATVEVGRVSISARTSAPGFTTGDLTATFPRAPLSARVSAPQLVPGAAVAMLARVTSRARVSAPDFRGPDVILGGNPARVTVRALNEVSMAIRRANPATIRIRA